MIHRARDVSRHRVYGFGLTGVTRRLAGIDQAAAAPTERNRLVQLDQGPGVYGGLEAGAAWGRAGAGLQLKPRPLPGLQAAVQDRNPFVARVAQQPPQARGVGAAGSIVSRHLLAVVQPQGGKTLLQDCRRRHGMPPAIGGWRAAEISAQIGVNRTGQMARQIGPAARACVRQIVLAIHDRPGRVAEAGLQGLRFD